jgi:5-methylcytosine-specific restriction endonuclease McrA
MKYLLERKEFIDNVSRKGTTIQMDTVYNEPENPKSSTNKILLKNYYKKKEYFEIIDKLGEKLKLTKNAIKKLKNGYNTKKPLKWSLRKYIIQNNLNFLKKTQEKNGVLTCEYCGKTPLKIYNTNKIRKEDMATVDHKQPMALGGDWFDEENLAVCCVTCNGEKSDMSYTDWINQF